MPDPAICNKIKDPAERKKCLGYKGKYAKKVKAPKGGPTNEMSRVKSSKGGY